MRLKTEITLCDQCKDEGKPDSANARQKVQSYVINNGKTSRTVDLCRPHGAPLEHLIALKPLNRYPIVTKTQAKKR